MRTETRRERQRNKASNALSLPYEIATINFQIDDNVAFVIRSAACFGCSTVNVIGSLPDHKTLMAKSGSTQDLVKINQFSNVHHFLEYIKDNNISLISAELDDESSSIYDFEFPKTERFCIVLGHEISGVPVEILRMSKKVYIPMKGRAFCLNTSQAGTVFMHEASKCF